MPEKKVTAESIWGTLKCEKYYLHTYQAFDQSNKDIEDSSAYTITNVYNANER